MQAIPLLNLSLILIPASLVVLILWRWTGNGKTALYALARMVGQLCLIGFVLTHLFNTQHSLLISTVLLVMLLISSWIALRSVSSRRPALYAKALIATSAVNLALLILITKAVLMTSPWFEPSVLIPIAGMIFAVGMNSIGLFSERFFSELSQKQSQDLPTKPAQQHIIAARNTAFNATLIPIINSLFAVGLVSLPGMMTGQILSGVSPLIAVRYQIMVMLMIFSSAGLTTALFYQLIKPTRKQEKAH